MMTGREARMCVCVCARARARERIKSTAREADTCAGTRAWTPGVRLSVTLALDCHPPQRSGFSVPGWLARARARPRTRRAGPGRVRHEPPTGPALSRPMAQAFHALVLGSQIELAAAPICPALGLIPSGSSWTHGQKSNLTQLN